MQASRDAGEESILTDSETTESSKDCCWGAVLQGSSGESCTQSFVIGSGHFKNKFCPACRAGMDVPVSRIRALTPELAQALGGSKQSSGFWKAGPTSMGGGHLRVINNTKACREPYLVCYADEPPALDWATIPREWISQSGDVVTLVIARGTLRPQYCTVSENHLHLRGTKRPGPFDAPLRSATLSRPALHYTCDEAIFPTTSSLHYSTQDSAGSLAAGSLAAGSWAMGSWAMGSCLPNASDEHVSPTADAVAALHGNGRPLGCSLPLIPTSAQQAAQPINDGVRLSADCRIRDGDEFDFEALWPTPLSPMLQDSTILQDLCHALMPSHPSARAAAQQQQQQQQQQLAPAGGSIAPLSVPPSPPPPPFEILAGVQSAPAGERLSCEPKFIARPPQPAPLYLDVIVCGALAALVAASLQYLKLLMIQCNVLSLGDSAVSNAGFHTMQMMLVPLLFSYPLLESSTFGKSVGRLTACAISTQRNRVLAGRYAIVGFLCTAWAIRVGGALCGTARIRIQRRTRLSPTRRAVGGSLSVSDCGASSSRQANVRPSLL